MKGIDLLVFFVNQTDQFLIFNPATKMNNGKKNEECPVINKQSGQHHCSKNQGSNCSCSECLQVKGHVKKNDSSGKKITWIIRLRYYRLHFIIPLFGKV